MRFLSKKGIYDSSRVLYLPLDAITPNPHQPRTVFAQQELEELAQSIQSLGILQPLTVRRQDGGWELVAGERRLRAARLAGLTEVPCLSVQTDGQASAMLALVENLQRQDLDFWEEAAALRSFLDTYHTSQEELARRLGKSQSAVANKLRLLKLAPGAAAVLREGGATERHARALLRLPTERQEEAARQVVEQSLTVARTEALVDSLLAGGPLPQRKRPVYIIKDVRLFLNTITKSLDIMRSAGVDAQCSRQDTDEGILLTIRIPRRTR